MIKYRNKDITVFFIDGKLYTWWLMPRPATACDTTFLSIEDMPNGIDGLPMTYTGSNYLSITVVLCASWSIR